MPDKRKRTDAETRSVAPKRSRHTAQPDLISPLSDELLVRILSFLPLADILSLGPVSNRFFHLSSDSQIWKGLYYSQFVLPRALRIPGFRDGSAREGKLHYSSRKALWADGRRGGWVDIPPDRDRSGPSNWKRQYKLRHNWSRGTCASEELKMGPESDWNETANTRNMLVKVSEGFAITADIATGIRVWDLRTKQLQAEMSLDEQDSSVVPTCIAIDEQDISHGLLHIAVGFADGGFGIWGFNVKERLITRRQRHEKSSNGELVEIAMSYPYLLTATKSVLVSLYTFDIPVAGNNVPDEKHQELTHVPTPTTTTLYESSSERGMGRTGEISSKQTALPAPYLLTSLKSHTSRTPLALSIRKTAGSTIASIAYTFSTLRGWSLGIQDLHLRRPKSGLAKTPEVSMTQLAYSPPSSRQGPARTRPPPASLSTTQNNEIEDGPINLCYTHPYLLATLPDNTLVLHLCTSSASSLVISPGIRLWGHTSGISDAEITSRGKAVTVSSRGEEIRVWELEGRAGGRSIEVRPTTKIHDDNEQHGAQGRDSFQWEERRNWVGFDDEMVIVLKEVKGRESLMVYDFT